jgi:hypothetical protein
VNEKTFERLRDQYNNRKRKGTEESDCTIVEQVWRLYWANLSNELGCKTLQWLLHRLTDKESNKLSKNIIYQHLYLNRNSIPKKHKKLFRKTLKEIPKKKRKKLKIDRA